jgi:ubiquinone/menaquinone biosynthesis C-methylase UbiE
MSENNTYILGTGGMESGRLIEQEHLLTDAMGGLFPCEIDLSQVATVLNLGCGPGEWDNRVAFEYPDMTIVGVDIDPDMIKHAKAFANVYFLENITFERMDIKEPLDFPDDSFDLINGRLLCSFLDQEAWPRLLTECRRVLRPGGVILMSEVETAISNSLALHQLQQCLFRVLANQKRTFSVDGHSIGICHLLGKLLHDAGYREVASKSFSIDSSSGALHHLSGCRDTEMAFVLLKPYLLKTGLVKEAEYEALLYQMQIDMRKKDFACLAFGLQAWGYKSCE